MDHFKKHFLYRQWLEISQPSADGEANLEEEEEDFDDYSMDLMPTPFSVMRDNFEGALHAWKLVLDESILGDLKKMSAHSSPNQTPPEPPQLICTSASKTLPQRVRHNFATGNASPIKFVRRSPFSFFIVRPRKRSELQP